MQQAREVEASVVRDLSPAELGDDIHLHDSRVVRGLLLVAGMLAVAAGVVGIVVPIMPTVPFLLLAAACFARASPTCYRRLVSSPRFGPLILEWRRHRSIPWRVKCVAIVLLAASLGTSIALFVRPAWLQALVALVGIAIAACLYRIPSRDRPSGR